MNVVWFLFKEGFKGLARSKYAGAFSIVIIALSLILIGFGYVIARDMIFAVENIRAKFDVDIFLKNTAAETEIRQFEEFLRNRIEVESVVYISADSAARRFEEEFGEDIFEILEENPLPPSFTIRLKLIYRNLVSVEGISNLISGEKVVDEIQYRKKFLQLLEKYQRISLVAVFATYALLTLVSIVIVSNSIKMTIFARYDVISTMKLIGATNNFIKAPFIIEGTLQGLIGSGLAVAVILAVFYLFNNYLQTMVDYKFLVGKKFYIILVMLGFVGGFIGSRRAIRKFLS